MSSDKRTSTASSIFPGAPLAAALFAFALSGCSADVTRFDPPSFSLTDDKGAAPPSTGPRAGYSSDPYAAPPRAGLTGEGATGVPPPGRTASLPPPTNGYSAPLPPPETRQPQAERRPPARTATPGETIEVHQGDTLYGIARKHNVSVSALIELNGLGSKGTIKPGQKLVLPAAPSASNEPAPGRAVMPRFPTAKAPAAQPQAQALAQPQPTPGWDATHTMRSGESLYGIARQYKVTLAELQRVNGITEPTRVRIGAVLKVPGEASSSEMRQPPPARVASAPTPVSDAPAPSVTTPGVRVINQPRAQAEEPPQASEPAQQQGVRFRWPARGRVIAGFGKRPDGTHNDGINVSVPMGTDIVAAEGGRVAYAGGDIQAYGNLILIRHENGWVSAYAHADKILVQRDEVVKRGQVIAKAGRTGAVDQPQVHFELRQGAKPVDPLPHMEKAMAAN